MDLRDSIEWISHHEKELCLFNIDPCDAIQEGVETYFRTQNVRITVKQTASGSPEDVAVLSDELAMLAVVDVSPLRRLLEEGASGRGELGIADER
ncbi:hypothetical protein VB773_22680 [Haloarculaceae archaeon H-GB2-1]|nr:hypothetical protein [Haloarculaceae archaeon H-GB1-1]MEA5389445.1 hypothetical protein [Haloarculaceae archaeon H-GB11]MEA5410106.1 hypothetical protein [Haloarculaceae archaeon H-GB2-1]